MKPTAVTLLTLALFLGSAWSVPTEQPTSVKGTMRDVVGMIMKYMTSDDNTPFPRKEVLSQVLNMLPDMNMTNIKTSIYSTGMSAVRNVEMNTPKCINSISPPDVCNIAKSCIPDALDEASRAPGYAKGISVFKENVDTCILDEASIRYDAAYNPTDFADSIRSLITAIVNQSNLDQPIKDSIINAIGNICVMPPQDAPICDKIAFEKCLVHVCVLAMA